MKKIYVLIIASVISFSQTQAQLVVLPDTNILLTVNSFVLGGVTTSNIQYTGGTNTLGNFSNGNTTNLGLSDGIIMTTGNISNPQIGNTVGTFASTSNGEPGCPELDLLSGYTTYDASILEFDLVPVGNILEFNYIFASEEYPEYVGSSYNDVFAFFISGPNPIGGNYHNLNIAEIPGTALPVAINNVNQTLNSTYFVNNELLGGQDIIFDGFTTLLTAQIDVIPANTYHLKMAISDVGDEAFDSAIFLKAQSMKSYNSTGIKTENTESCKVFTSTGSGQLIIITDNHTNNKAATISDIQGQALIQQPINNAETKIDINNLPKGIYFISVSGENILYNKKFIKL